MATIAEPAAAATPLFEAPSRRFLTVRRLLRNRLAVVGLLVLVALTVICFSAPLWLPYSNALNQLRDQTFAPPSGSAWFGRDEYGRDAFARAVYGGRVSLWISFSAAVVATAIGTALGVLGGYLGGWIDGVIDRLVELFLTLPFLLLLILAAAVMRPSMTSILLILGLFGWPVLTRIVRNEFMACKRREYVEAAHVVGCSRTRVAIRHILPNVAAPIIVFSTLTFAMNVTAEAAISFLGLGIQPPTPSWGNLLTNAQDYVISSPFLAIFPGLLILITVLCVNLLGDGLRDALDPRQRI